MRRRFMRNDCGRRRKKRLVVHPSVMKRRGNGKQDFTRRESLFVALTM
jgi:hypothetical protein